ncbi:ADP-ribosylglycohydrolase family protein [Rhodococcus sp. HNM0569]|uniref:ADP-ribosylglycohydrolase family protein n=1 Tax=Rhodococcus sp. HNM0569 TaxID=2716340 RepID=UPI00146CCF71|nr:ADP-ribosylglycohydrolase family protein [Rhodococcus sp. HNM0569]NLU84372.1 ADP-ribosylglycohydrolase family protein [Rhodococcus sp. HNM0569]
MVITREHRERAAGALVASAVGDALGAGYEFTHPTPDTHIDMIGGGPFGFAPGEWTDDTSMTIAVATAATQHDLRTCAGLDSVVAEFLRWSGSNPKDIGNQTRAVLSQVPASAAEMTRVAQALPGRTGGNGSLMRTSPVGLRHLDDGVACIAAARAVSDLTHSDPRAGEACEMWSYAIRHAVLTGTFDGVRQYLDVVGADTKSFWTPLLDQAERGAPADFPNNGWVVHALQTAWWAITSTDRSNSGHLAAALEQAVRAGNDTDTVAAIAGGLLGARWGLSAVPPRWRSQLHGWPGSKADYLEDLADRILDCIAPRGERLG